MIEYINEYISEKLANIITVGKYFSFIANESTIKEKDNSRSVCCVNDNKIIKDFIDFHEISDLTGCEIVRTVFEKLATHKMLFYLISQDYDGAGVMSGEAIIREHSLAAAFVHCASHAQNLLISQSSYVAEIHDCWNDVTEIVNFHVSPHNE